ncbi:MAG: cytochrome P460 family protein [Chitinophagaceae bacterium]|nr:cytochrome P460 family protein [Chitinophagaceae bacterium]
MHNTLNCFNFPVWALLLLSFLSGCNMIIPKDSQLPADLPRNATPAEAAEFAWQSFLTISQPEKNGNGTQWENYKEAFDIFMPGAAMPSPWGEPTEGGKTPCDSLFTGKVLRTTSKISPLIDEVNQAVGGVLLDRNSNPVFYEVYMNKPMFNYILKNQLYNAVTQAGTHINFPVGSMELKASWRILNPAVDDTSRYHTARAIIYLPNTHNIRNTDCLPKDVLRKLQICSQELVGLVGLHMVYKAPSHPSFTWMTFEQVDNVDSSKNGSTLIPASFINKDKAMAYCPENSRQCNCPEQESSQITRQNQIPGWVTDANRSKRDSLKKAGSVWQYYQLIGIQWASDTTRSGNPMLANLANTSMETYNQTSSSCIGCHNFARSTNPTILSDFSWVMGRAYNPVMKLPDANGPALLKYIMRESPYKKWGTWPNSKWNTYSGLMKGENPHGNSVRIYVNDIALNYAAADKLPANPQLPVGSIVMKENYRTIQPDPAEAGDLVELTVMYKANDKDGNAKWFWMKARPYGPVEIAGFDRSACVSCHVNWKGNGDGLLSFNFGKRPVITETPYSAGESAKTAIKKKELNLLRKYLVQN